MQDCSLARIATVFLVEYNKKVVFILMKRFNFTAKCDFINQKQPRGGGTATKILIFAGMEADEKIHARVHALQDTLRLGEIAYLIADDYLRRKGSECCQNTNILWIACQNIGEADIALRASAARSGYLSALVNYCYAIISAA